MKIMKNFSIILAGIDGAGGLMDFEKAQEYIGMRIRHKRRLAKLSQEELAAKAKVGVKVIGKIETYRGNPTLKTLGKIAKSLGLGIEEICPGNGAVISK